VAKWRLIVAAMLDLHNLKSWGEGLLFHSCPQSSSAFKIQDGGYSIHSPKKYACVAG